MINLCAAAFLLGEELVAFLDLIRAGDGTTHTLDRTYQATGTWAATLSDRN